MDNVSSLQRSIALVSFLMSVFLLTIVPTVSAETQITITNSTNGSSSENSGTYIIDRQQNVQQSNLVQVNNSVQQNANTGNNAALDNSADIEIITGDIQSTTSISNVGGLNLQDQSVCDCDQDIELINQGNGSESSNSATIDTSSMQNLSQNNTVDIANKSTKDLNTGGNSAKDNMGNVVITTGSINEDSSFDNKAGANSASSENDSDGVSISIINEKNGRGSTNFADVTIESESLLSQENKVKISNKEHKDLNTGDNKCKDNQGSCVIGTGDINSSTDITNETGSNIIKPDAPKGGPIPTPTPGKDDETPIGGGDVDGSDPKTPEGKDDGDILEGVRDQIAAAVKTLTGDSTTVLGAMTLPNTGVGGEIPTVAWSDVLVGLLLLFAGLYLRRPLDKWLTVKEK